MGIYQHYRKEEHSFIDQVLSWQEYVKTRYQAKLTDFLDPREQQIVESVIGKTNDEIQLRIHSGTEHLERKRLIIAPFYEDVTDTSFRLTLMQATYNEKFISLLHRDVMGAFLSLGITRDKLGDIFVTAGHIQIMMAEEIANYVSMNLTTIKNANISLTEEPITKLLEKEMDWIETDTTVSSLRLDTVLSEIYKMSRKEASAYIKKKQVKVNFKLVVDPKFLLYAGDLISVRGKGRSKFVAMNGETRKNKQRITVARLK
ncbi:MAG TPA: YlmH/Sll1252 family protein [Virgibacillus sp.]|nr:YlmH/Sll1252 family protein [Virgibacillus sp.]